MANCNGLTPSPTPNNCFSSNSGTITKVNCGCTPCDTPVVIQQGDVSTQVLVPVLADVIQNCMCINKYETAYPINLVFQTNIPVTASPTGRVCITGVTYGYSCIGSEDEQILGHIDSKSLVLSSGSAACSCAAEGRTPVNLYTQYSGTTKTNSCCCNQVDQPYALSKIVEQNVSLSICSLNVTISGTIGATPFTATLIGTENYTGTAIDLFPTSPLPLSTFLFPETMNFAGRLCLPTNTRLNISEEFDNCLIFDCIRPIHSTYTPTPNGGTALTFATFTASADLSLVINKHIYATTTEKLAVMTNSGAQVVCTDGATTTPVCPPFSPCTSTSPCPGPSSTSPSPGPSSPLSEYKIN